MEKILRILLIALSVIVQTLNAAEASQEHAAAAAAAPAVRAAIILSSLNDNNKRAKEDTKESEQDEDMGYENYKHKCTYAGCAYGTNWSQSVLELHIRQKHTHERPYVCKTCKKAFPGLSNLREHMNVHTGKRLQCDKCVKSYTSHSSLIAHKKTKHLKIRRKCPYCHKTYPYDHLGDLKKHTQQCPQRPAQATVAAAAQPAMPATDSEAKRKKQKTYICAHCNEHFKSSEDISIHLEMHRSEALNDDINTEIQGEDDE